MIDRNNFIKHHGILGMKWGVRRFQNKDGTLTAAGKKRYSTNEKAENKLVDASNTLSRSRSWYNGPDKIKATGREFTDYRNALANFCDAFPNLKSKIAEANKITHQMESMNEDDAEEAWKKVNSFASSYAKEVDRIMKPYADKLMLDRDYELLRYDIVDSGFWDNLYGYRFG